MLIRHASGAYFSIKQMSAVYVLYDNVRQSCDILLYTDIFISENMLRDILEDAGATSIIIETPQQDCPRWWLATKMTAIWNEAADSKLEYYHTGPPFASSNVVMRTTAKHWILKNTSRLQKTESFSSTVNGLDDIAVHRELESSELPPEDQIEAFKLWMKHIWGTDCPIEAC
jgi:hypothetical protein